MLCVRRKHDTHAYELSSINGVFNERYIQFFLLINTAMYGQQRHNSLSLLQDAFPLFSPTPQEILQPLTS